MDRSHCPPRKKSSSHPIPAKSSHHPMIGYPREYVRCQVFCFANPKSKGQFKHALSPSCSWSSHTHPHSPLDSHSPLKIPWLTDHYRTYISIQYKSIHICIYIYTNIHTLNYITSHCITLHYITLPYIHACMHASIHTYITSHHITLHYITLHCITLQYITINTCIHASIHYITLH